MAIQRTDVLIGLGGLLNFTRFTIGYSDLVEFNAYTSGTTLALFTLPKGGKMLGVTIMPTVQFVGAAVSAMTCSVGSAIVGAAGFATAYDVFQAPANTALQDSAQYKSGGLAAQVVYTQVISTGAHLDVLTAGSATVDVLWLDVTTPL